MQYKILNSHDSAILEKEVQKCLGDGWRLAGDLAVVAPVVDGRPTPLYGKL